MQRFRHRLLNCQPRNGFDPDSPLANVPQYADKFDFPSTTLSNRPLVKMPDNLLLQLSL
jgi:hypothetical protein